MKTKVLFLSLNVFGSTGGVQSVCKAMSHLLANIPDISVKVCALHDRRPDPRYISGLQFKGHGGLRSAFVSNALFTGFSSNIIILSHINLLAIAMLIKLFNPTSRVVLIAHGTEVWRPVPSWKKWFIRNHVKIWSVSNYTRKIIQERHHISDNIEVIHNCIDPFFKFPKGFKRPEYLLKRYRLFSAQPVLLTLCRVQSYEHGKGYDKMLEVIPDLLKQYPGIHYLLCGEMSVSEQIRLQKVISIYRLEGHVTLTGWIPEAELSDHYLLADYFILPSQKEGFGIVTIEAAACGCDVLVANSCGSPEAALYGRLAKMIDASTPVALHQALHDHLNAGLNSISKKDRQQLVIDHFGFEQHTSKIRKQLLDLNKPYK